MCTLWRHASATTLLRALTRIPPRWNSLRSRCHIAGAHGGSLHVRQPWATCRVVVQASPCIAGGQNAEHSYTLKPKRVAGVNATLVLCVSHALCLDVVMLLQCLLNAFAMLAPWCCHVSVVVCHVFDACLPNPCHGFAEVFAMCVPCLCSCNASAARLPCPGYLLP